MIVWNRNTPRTSSSRRTWLHAGVLFALTTTATTASAAAAAETTTTTSTSNTQVSAEELDALYDNPAIPTAPEERCGLVVLRVAEVAQFQEQILRAVAQGELPGVQLAPLQFSFGTQILLRNSNLDGNMKLMIQQEIPRQRRKDAVRCAINTMNTLQDIAKYADSIQRDFETEEMIAMADMYLSVRVNLNQMYEYLPPKEQDKYEGYFVAVTEYEKKIAEGTYNPDIDGKLKFDYRR